jgi:hypothetical protein
MFLGYMGATVALLGRALGWDNILKTIKSAEFYRDLVVDILLPVVILCDVMTSVVWTGANKDYHVSQDHLPLLPH